MSEPFDLVIRAGHFLSMAPVTGEEIVRDVFIGILDGKIRKITPWTETGWAAKEMIDASHQLAMPGLINGHCHLPMSLFRGLADDLPFGEWLTNYIFPLEAKLVDPAFCSLGTEISVLESLRSGSTTVVDMYYFEPSVAEICEQAGIRALLGQSFIDFPAPDNKKLDGNDWRLMDELRLRYADHPTIQPLLAPHAPYTVSNETFQKVRDYALKHDLAITVHVSETKTEVAESLKQFKKTPLQRLADLGVLDAKTIMAHCVYLTEKEMKIAADKNAGIVHNPESNMKLGVGAAPIRALINSGIKVGIGTDGAASNNDLNLFKEMDTAAKLQKFVHEDNTAMTAMMALRMATREGAEALGIGDKVGSLETGKCADVLLLSLSDPNMMPLHSISSQLVYATTGREVDTVIIQGKVVLRNGRACSMDKEDIISRLNAYRKKTNL